MSSALASPPAPAPAPGVTLGYLVAGATAAALWIGIGALLIPMMLVLAALHWLGAAESEPVIASHHRWLARHHLLAGATLILVLVAPLLVLPTLMTSARTVLNTLAYAPHPAATLAAAWPQLGAGRLMVAAFVASTGWLLVTLWISVRVIRRWLRWADRRRA